VSSSFLGIYSAPLLGVAYCLALAQLTDACYSTSVSGPSQVCHFSRRQRDWHLDASVNHVEVGNDSGWL